MNAKKLAQRAAAAVVAYSMSPASAEDQEERIQALEPIMQGAEMPDPEKRPVVLTKSGVPLRTRAVLNKNLDRDRAILKKGTRDDHPAFAIAKENTARKQKDK